MPRGCTISANRRLTHPQDRTSRIVRRRGARYNVRSARAKRTCLMCSSNVALRVPCRSERAAGNRPWDRLGHSAAKRTARRPERGGQPPAAHLRENGGFGYGKQTLAVTWAGSGHSCRLKHPATYQGILTAGGGRIVPVSRLGCVETRGRNACRFCRVAR